MTAMVIDNISHKVSQITMKDGTLVYNGLRLEVIRILCSASSVMLQPAEALQELQSPGVYLHVLQRCCCMRTAEDVTLHSTFQSADMQDPARPVLGWLHGIY